MIKKGFLWLFSLSFIVSMICIVPVTAEAADTTAIYIIDTVGGDPVTVLPDSSSAGSGWSYSATDQTLTLSGFHGESIVADGDINIALDGTNTITVGDSINAVYYIAGIYSKGIATITSKNDSLSDDLTLTKEVNCDTYCYYYGIYAKDTEINGGHVKANFTQASGCSYNYTVCATDEATVNQSAKLSVNINGTRASVFGTSLYANTTEEITFTADIPTSLGSGLIDYLSAKGSGDITISNPNGNALFGKLDVNSTAGTITFQGYVSQGKDYDWFRAYHLPEGYRIITDAGECGFLRKAHGSYNSVVLCLEDGTKVTSATIKKVESDPLTFLDNSDFDLEESTVGKSVLSSDFHGFVYGGKTPYTYSVTGLPAGLKLNNTKTPNYSYEYECLINGTLTEACAAGDAVITVTDAEGTSKSITIHYGTVEEPDKFLSVNGTSYNMKKDVSLTSGFSYDHATKTLTLVNYSGGPISAEADLNIVFSGNNYITLSDATYSENGIKVTGKATLSSASGTTDDILMITKEINCSTYSYYQGINTTGGTYIESGSVYVRFTEASGCSYNYSACPIAGGSCYVNGSANLDIRLNGPKHLKSSSMSLYANTSGTIDHTVIAPEDAYVCAVDYLVATGSGTVNLACTNGFAVDGKITISDTAGPVNFTGIVCLGHRTDYCSYKLPKGYRMVSSAGECGFLKQDDDRYNRAMLCLSDGTLVKSATIQKVESDPLTFLDYDGFDIKDETIGTRYLGKDFGLFIYGGKAPYTYSATGLPEGLKLNRTASYSGDYDCYITGTPTAACDAGTATITVTDADGASQSITINYDAMYSGAPVTGLTIDKTTVDATVGDTVTITATVLPAEALDRTVTWTSSKVSVADLASATGDTATFKINNAGTATITASAWGGFKKTCTIRAIEATPEAYVKILSEGNGIVTGLNHNKKYSVEVDGTTVEVSNVESFNITSDMLGKTIYITCINDDSSCNSEKQALPIPSALSPKTIEDYKTNVINLESSYPYTGEYITPDIDIPGLTKDVDYKVYYLSNRNAGTATVRVCGCGEYIGQFELDYQIAPKSIADLTTRDAIPSYEFTGKAITPSPVFLSGMTALTAGTDYTLSYQNNKEVGTATITVTGTGNYTGEKTFTFEITASSVEIDINSLDWVDRETTYTYCYTGSAISPSIFEFMGESPENFVNGTDWTSSYKNNVNAGTATLTVTGIGRYAGTREIKFYISRCPLQTIKVSTSTYYYDGKVKTPTVTVTAENGKTLLSKVSKSTTKTTVKLTYPSGRKLPGTYKATATGLGNYEGSKTASFKIAIKPTTLKTVSAVSKGFKATWTKQSGTYVSGYQIQYATSSKFTSAKTVVVSGASSSSKTITKLKPKKKYYVRIRTYKTISGKKYYSSWSKAKSVTTKS